MEYIKIFLGVIGVGIIIMTPFEDPSMTQTELLMDNALNYAAAFILLLMALFIKS
jgi:hypothetical protein